MMRRSCPSGCFAGRWDTENDQANMI